MTDSTITINAGPPQQIGANLAQGYTIRNQSTTTGLWLRGDPTVAIGNGQKLGALGSILWNGGPCYAALDATTGSATVSLSTNTQQVNDPVAVAQAINLQGVPNVLTGTVIASGASLPSLGANQFGFTGLDVSTYASVIIQFRPQSIGQVFADCFTANVNTGGLEFPVTAFDTNGLTFVLPVTGPTLNFTWLSSLTGLNYTIYGTNRAVPRAAILNSYVVAVHAHLNQAFTSGTPVNLFTVVSNGMQAYIRMVITGTGQGFIGMTLFTDTAGTTTEVDILDSKTGIVGSDGQETEKIVIIPPGKLQMVFNPRTSASYTVVCELIQQVL